ncbi:MAG TPA: methionine biosynthesis protein MetW [bacterium]|nr:methionine biosynthesis protein MetW [bacterium]
MIRRDFDIIERMVQPNARVLDLGCGDGSLLEKLVSEKNVRAHGVEISEQLVQDCIMKGLSVLHFDIDKGLVDYRDRSFDYVILNQTLQAVRNPKLVIDDALRVAKQVIIGFPNFAFWSIRWNLALFGKIHNTRVYPYKWYDESNIHLLTVKDFADFCEEEGIRIVDREYIGRPSFLPRIDPNSFAEVAIFCIKR